MKSLILPVIDPIQGFCFGLIMRISLIEKLPAHGGKGIEIQILTLMPLIEYDNRTILTTFPASLEPSSPLRKIAEGILGVHLNRKDNPQLDLAALKQQGKLIFEIGPTDEHPEVVKSAYSPLMADRNENIRQKLLAETKGLLCFGHPDDESMLCNGSCPVRGECTRMQETLKTIIPEQSNQSDPNGQRRPNGH